MTTARGPASPAPLLAALALGAIAAFAPQLFNDGDTWTHVAAGRRMLEMGAVLHVDPFSYTFAGRPWQTHEWLSEIAMALAWRAGGWGGVALLSAVAAGATAALLARHAGRWLGGPALALVLALCLGALAPSLLARPHLLALPFLEMWTAELVIARHEGRMPSWWRLAALMVVWSNLHASFLFGLGLLGSFGLEALLRAGGSRLATFRRWAVVGGLSAVAVVVSPHGLDNLLFPFRLTSLKTLSGIAEWAPMDVIKAPGFEAALLIGVFVLVWKRVRVPLLSLLLLLLLVHLSLTQVRHVLLFGIVAPLLVAEPLGEALGREAGSARANRILAAVAAVLLVALAAVRIALPFRPADSGVAPAAALASVPAGVRAQPVFNAYQFGGYLMFNGVRPYIDSRAEVYGDPFRATYAQIAAGDACLFRRTLQERRIAWTLLEPGSPLAPLLDREPGWRRVHADAFAVVHLRQAPPPPSGPAPACPPAGD